MAYEGSALSRAPAQETLWREKTWGPQSGWGVKPSGEATPPSMRRGGIRGSRYGVFGSPWGDVPPELDAPLRSTTGYDSARLYEMERLMEEEGLDWWDAYGRAAPHEGVTPAGKGMRLVEEKPGHWSWTGGENDPEYLAYKEGTSQQRRLAAHEKLRQSGQHWSQSLPSSKEEDSVLSQLFAAHEGPPQLRAGQTAATKAGSVGSPMQPGYLGMQSARFAPGVRRRGGYIDPNEG